MTEVLRSPQAANPRTPMPGDGAYLAPRPGDGNYLMNGSAGPSTRGNRGNGGRGRGAQGTRGGMGARGNNRRDQAVTEVPRQAVAANPSTAMPPPPPPTPPVAAPTIVDMYPQYSGPIAPRPPPSQPVQATRNYLPNIPNSNTPIIVNKHSPNTPNPNPPNPINQNHTNGSNGYYAPPSGPSRPSGSNDAGHSNFVAGPKDNGYRQRNGLAPPANVKPVVQPRADAAVRSGAPPPHPNHHPQESGFLNGGHRGGSSVPNTPRGVSVIPTDRRGGRTPRGRGRGGNIGSSEGIRERPAHLNATAPAFAPQPPTESFARLAMAVGETPTSNTPASSRASSSRGKPRAEASGSKGVVPPKENEAAESEEKAEEVKVESKITPTAPKSSRRAAFEQQTKLTPAGDAQIAKQEEQAGKESQVPAQKKVKVDKDDLISRLTRGLGKRPFVECPICFNSITPSQPIFCCLPPTAPPPVDLDDNAPTNHYQACYTPFHLSCIRDWADRSLAEESEKIRTNALVENDGKVKRPEWRCPGCQKRRVDRVGLYKCFCGRVTSPSTNLILPHSCAEPCSRPRPLCSHPCTLPCHPGPCPPCQVALIVPCPSHHSSLTVKCAAATAGANMTPVCDEVCGKERGCGDRSHVCQLLCHFGPCAPCTESEEIRCYCGAETREETCGWKKDDEMQCARAPESGVEEHWSGRWGCGRLCEEAFDCGIHTCEETCHPHPLSPLPCPNSPSQITTCPCAQTPLSLLCQPNGPQPARTKCTDPIPTCDLPCPRARPCGHQCPLKCHHGECPPCKQDVVRPCRCGESVFTVRCEEFGERIRRGEGEMKCERICKALRNCGRHECSRVCCPLSYKAKSSRLKKKAGTTDIMDMLVAPGEEDLHACSLTCGKWLSCGLHTCQRKDHRGACGRCLQASYDELICHCGESIIYPPVACGTTITCVYPCARPPPACGHPKTSHNCHESPNCPPCPYLTTRPCACGKDPAVKHVRCSQSIVSCGQACGSLLSCGYHRCDKTCHKQGPGECGDCTQVCGKPKRVCRHPCTSVCHAPAKCPEGDPCGAIVDQKCACGNLTSRTTCGASAGKGESRELIQLKCNSECLVKQRNARLAEALGIKGAEGRNGGDGIEWSAELKAFAQGNWAFVKMVESALADFMKGGKQSHILPQMPAAKRTFVMSLCQVYRLSTDLLDAEPNRSIMIRRKIDTRTPSPLLTAAVPQPYAAGVEKKTTGLTNLRASTPTSSSGSSGATWGKIVAPTPSAWGGGSGLLSGTSTPGSVYHTPMSSRAISPAVPESSGSATMTVPVNQTGTQSQAQMSGLGLGLARKQSSRQGVVGEVGKVEEDDWDVDA